jgi:hypothetical protein
MHRLVRSGLRVLAVLTSLAVIGVIPMSAASADTPSTPVTEHVSLGFTTTIPISQTLTGGEAGIDYEFSVDGEATLSMDLGADLTITYDREDLVPGGTVPVEVTYQPTNDPGPELDLDVVADLVADVDVSAGTYVAACIPLSPLFPLCPVLAALDSIDESLQSFDVASLSGDFVAPLGADAPIVVPGTGDTALASFAGLDLLSASVSASATLAPVPSGVLPGLGGAATVATASDATLVGGEVPGVDVLEWQAAGSSQTVSMQLPVSGPGTAGLDLSPVYHWLNASASVGIDLDFEGIFGVLGDPGTISVFSGSIGQLLVDAGVDTQIGDAVAGAIGFDPGFAAQVAAGNIPVPLTDPAGASIPPLDALGGVSFLIDLDADDDGLLDGTEIAAGTNPDNADSDGDGLSDGDEVNVHGTDPLNPDSDGDGLSDGDEVNVHGTDPLNPDTDADGLDDGTEVAFGTDPLDADSDDDGIPDGQDVEFVQNAIEALGDTALKAGGHRTALLSQLDSIEKSIARGHTQQALTKLANLTTHVDGCGTSPDGSDWIVDCGEQIAVRNLLLLLASNLS